MFRKQYLVVLLFSAMAFSQSNSFEIGIVSENDLYTSLINDKYYTNGLSLYFSYLNENSNPLINKKTTTFRINHSAFTPKIRNVTAAFKVDRPPAGLLFAEIKKGCFYENQSVFKLGFQVGFIGPNALAEEFQNTLHRFIGIDDVQGWQFQIQNTLVLQTNVMFSRKLSLFQKNQSLDLHLQSESNFGTAFNSTSFGLNGRIGLKKLLPVYDSNFYGASINSDKSKYKTTSESYFFINPNISYHLYDATFQGSMFENSSPVTYGLIPFRFTGIVGYKYRKNNLTLSYSFVYQSKEAKQNKLTGYYFGSINLGFLF